MSRNSKKVQSPARRRALAVLARMRSRGESLSEAARNERTTTRTVRKIVGKQLKRGTSGHYSVTQRGDTFRRDLNVLGSEGYVAVSVRSSKQAQLASEHLNRGQSIPKDRRYRMAQAFRWEARGRR